METLTLLWIVSVAFTGLTKAAGVLPDGPLNAAVGETVMFSTTLTPQGTSIIVVNWKFGTKEIFTFNVKNVTAPEYEGRITYFMSTGSLELRNVALNDSGEYTVNIFLLGESPKPGNTRLDVLVKVSNVVATASSTDLVEFNSSVSLSCSSSGPSLSFLWLNSSSEVTGSDRVQLTDGGSNLTINNVTRYDQGPFRCNVFNPVSSDISNLINFSISYGPDNIHLMIFTSQEYYDEGSNIILMCSAESRPPAQFQWFLNGGLWSDGAELRLVDIQESLTKAAGLLPDGPLNAAVGETVMFSTTLPPQGTSIIVVNWNFGTKEIFTFAGKNFTAPEYEGRITFFMSTGSLELRNVALNDSGEYTVSIILFGESPKPGNTRLDVLVKVSNVVATASSTDLVEFSSSISLSCSSSGPSLSFLWLNSSSEVTGSDRVQLTDGGSTLTINNVTRYDQGPFRCNVSNPVSSGISNLIHFSISYGPDNIHLMIFTSQEYYDEGSNIILMCSAESRPPAQFQWFLNGDLRSDGAELRLMDIQESHSGNYSCQAFNSRTLRYITSQPESVTVLERISDASVTSTNLQIEGNSSKLTCDAAGSVFTRKWKKGVLDLTLTVNMSLSDNNRVLSFISLNKTDTGDYFCEISNPFSSEEAKYFLVVNYGPENVKITDDSETTLKLTCSAESVPPASYVWMLNGAVIHNSAVFTKDITDVSDGDDYVCEAMNNITGRKSSAVYRWTAT
ncbi:carcinoembryonic antigen-related cell adhesion molecule 5-like, partial [Cottoperca gobio]|uniref:Carcinoembryonic antigen-related cell adhesion molecule 5-like n=1 Tax=Cottoperca gobio TaxID=56716 RepID=A0A6J2PAK9_COTGO